MNRKAVDALMKLADELATARVQRYVTNLQVPEDKVRQDAAEQRVKLVRERLRLQLEQA